MIYPEGVAGPPSASSPGIEQGPERLGGTRLSTPSPEEIDQIPQGHRVYWRAGAYFVGVGHDPENRAVWLTETPGGRPLRSGNVELSLIDQGQDKTDWTDMSPELAATYARELIIYGIFLTLADRKPIIPCVNARETYRRE